MLLQNILKYKNPWKLSLQGFESFVGTVSSFVKSKTNHEGHAGKNGIFTFGQALAKKMVLDVVFMSSQLLSNPGIILDYEKEGNLRHNSRRRILDEARRRFQKLHGIIRIRNTNQKRTDLASARQAGKALAEVAPKLKGRIIRK